MPDQMVPSHYDWAKKIICEDEGERLFVYDSATGNPVRPGYTMLGNPTIGYGRDLCSRGMTVAEITVLLHGDLSADERAAQAFAGPAWDTMSRIRRAVVMSMAHNLGANGLDKFLRLKRAIRFGDWDEAASEIMDSDAASQLPLRYTRLSLMMRDDAYHPA